MEIALSESRWMAAVESAAKGISTMLIKFFSKTRFLNAKALKLSIIGAGQRVLSHLHPSSVLAARAAFARIGCGQTKGTRLSKAKGVRPLLGKDLLQKGSDPFCFAHAAMRQSRFATPPSGGVTHCHARFRGWL